MWAWVAIAGVVVYFSLDVVLVFLRPQFSVLHNAESDYGSSGPYGLLMDANFVLRCLLSLAAVRALALTVAPRGRLHLGVSLLIVWSVASGLLAFFPDDPVGTHTHGLGVVHVLLAPIAFVGVLLGTLVTSRELRRDPRWRPVATRLLVLASGALVPIVLLGHERLRPHSLGGLYEKTFLAVELIWFLVLATWIAHPTTAARNGKLRTEPGKHRRLHNEAASGEAP
jgi:hypothetical membrane protein